MQDPFPSDLFNEHGFAISSVYSSEEFTVLKNYSVNVLQRLFKAYANIEVSESDIKNYHLWGKSANVPHGEMLRAKNRHLIVPDEIKSVLLNQRFHEFLAQIGVSNFKLWDEGLGWLAFRMIRPSPGDGYPFSCKNWGPAKNVFSIWIPIIGFDQDLMIHLVPGSHLKEYPKYLPSNTHFTKDEYRLDMPVPPEALRPKMLAGEVLCFHPKTIHAEEVQKGSQTRINLEFRIVP